MTGEGDSGAQQAGGLQAQPHRLRTRVLVVVTALALIAALVVGVLLALGNSERAPKVGDLLAATKARGVVTGGAASATNAPSAAATRAGLAHGTVENATLAVTPPGGWTLLKRSRTAIQLAPPGQAGLLAFSSGVLGKPLSGLGLAGAIVSSIVDATPQAKLCLSPKKARVPNGPVGILVGVCYVLVPQQGRAIAVLRVFQAGTTARPAAFVVDYAMPNQQSAARKFLRVAVPVAATVQWKLFR